jgi:hypothetical protein
VNIGYTEASGNPVYSPMSWDSLGSWLIGLSMLPLAIGVYLGLYFLTKWKFKKLKMENNNMVF